MLSSLQKHIQKKYDKPFDEILRGMYVDQHMTMSEIAKELGVNIRTVQRWLKECGITARKMTWI